MLTTRTELVGLGGLVSRDDITEDTRGVNVGRRPIEEKGSGV